MCMITREQQQFSISAITYQVELAGIDLRVCIYFKEFLENRGTSSDVLHPTGRSLLEIPVQFILGLKD